MTLKTKIRTKKLKKLPKSKKILLSQKSSRKRIHSIAQIRLKKRKKGIATAFRKAKSNVSTKKEKISLLRQLTRTMTQYQAAIVIFLVLVGGASWYMYHVLSSIAASGTKTITTQADFEAGEYWNNSLDTTTTAGSLRIKAGGVGTWSTATPGSPENIRGQFNLAAQNAGAGADLTTDGTYIYLIWGGNLPDFWRYNPDTATWKQLADAPTPFFNNSAITYYNGAIYAITGHDGTVTTDASGEFYKYTISTNTWSKLPNALGAWGTVSGPGGADIKSAGNGKIYAVQGNAQTGFWQFDTVAGTWSELAPVPDPVTATNSHPLGYSSKSFVISGTTYCSTGCFYVFLGGAATFYRYDIFENQWYTSNSPAVPGGLGTIATGSAMAEDTVNHHIYALKGANHEFMKYVVGDPSELVAGTWDATTAATENLQNRSVTTGASLVYLQVNGAGYVYALLGGVPDLVRYDIANTRWDMIITQAAQGTNGDNLITYVPNGADCSDASGCIFVASAATANLRRFDVSTRTWTSMTNLAGTLAAGASMCYDGAGQLFITQGGSVNIFVHNIAAGAAGANGTTLTTPAALGVGSSITCMTDNRFYVLRGGATVSFYYSASGANPVADDNINTNGLPYQAASSGAALSNDGTYVYALIGNGRGTFLRFDPSQSAGSRWSERANLPTVTSTAAQAYTSVMEYDGVGNIYAIAGKYQKDFWRFDVSANSWTRAADLPIRMARSMGISRGNAGSTMYVMRGEGGISTYAFTPTDNTYIPSATWISAPIDLNYANPADSMTFAADETLNGQTITYATRTSSDGVMWSAWASTTNGGSITSTPQRYMQVKVTLNSSGGSATPVLNSFSVTFTKDSTGPANPTVTAYADATKAVSLTNTGSYFYTNPYFEFTSATESESQIDGYYAAWTTDSSFNPANTGLYGESYFQTANSYLVRRPMTRSGSGTIWYMRIATRDAAGNIASAQTAFQYTYTGISDATLKTWSTQGEFTAGGTSLTNVEATTSPGNVKLSAITNGAWTTEAPAPVAAAAGTTLIYVSANQKFYTMQTGARQLRSYDALAKTYTTLTNTYPVGNIGAGASMVLVSPNGATCIDTVGCIFMSRGANQRTFGRYNISGSGGVLYGAGMCGAGVASTADSWTQCADTPAGTTFNTGGSLAFDLSGTIYALFGNSQNAYRYSLANNAWTQLSNVDNAIGVGGTLTYAPNGSGCSGAGGCLFATRGGANNTHFYKGTLSSGGSVTWAYAPNTPTWFGDGATARRINTTIYFTRGYNAVNFGTNDFYAFNIVTNTWSRLANTPTNMYQGSEQGLAYNADNNFLYTFRGWSESSLFAYDILNDNWKRSPALPNFYTSNGFAAGVSTYDSAAGLLYVARGAGFSDFWSFNPTTNNWKQLADVPHTVNIGADAEYVNHSNDAYDGVYLISGNEGLTDNITYLFRYDPSTDMWTQLSYKTAAAANIVEVNAGADLVFDDSDNIYTAAGSSTWFSKYNISGNVWTDMTVAPDSDPLPGALANGSGSCAVKINVGGTNYIYLTRANSQANVFRYNLSTLSWDASNTVENAPAALVAGDACVLDGPDDGTAKILIPQGSTNTNMYVLDPDGDANGVWSTRTVPQTYSNGTLAKGPNNTILGFRGGNASAMDRYVVATASTGYQQNGTWTSEIFDFNGGQASGIFGYAGLQITMTGATDAYETVETRTCTEATCADNPNWVAATNKRTVSGVDNYTVASSVARYGQIRIRLTSDQVLTPTIQDVQWSYYVDNTVPNNPSVPVGGYTDSTKGTSITHNSWTNDLAPYFEWTATDDTNGIGIEGYYVYFGTDITKDPVTDASHATNLAYKTGTNYYAATGLTSVGSWNALTQSAAALTDGTYYLRIKTKDRNGNTTASAVDAFTYRVDGSRPNDISDLSVATYMLPTDTFSFSWTEPADVGPSGISQYCYHRGNLSDDCVNRATICSSGTCTINNVAHYQNRVNTFFVKARDAALNDATAYASTGYFYTGGPPTAPASVSVTPASMTDTNAFAVTWALPSTCLGQTPCSANDILRYCYTLNELPTVGTCGTNYSGTPTPSPDGGWTTDIQASGRQLTTFSAATQQGTNTIYIVAMDVVGNIDYLNYTTDTFDFTSNAPGAPADVSATDSSDRAANRFSVTLTWDEPTDEGSGVEGYNVYRCTTSCQNPDPDDDPPLNYTKIATVNTLGYLDTSLSNSTTYSYFMRSTGTGATVSGNSAVLSIKPEGKFKVAPAMSGVPTTKIRIRSAEISWLTQDDIGKNGDPIPHPASSYIQYGTTTGYEAGETGTPDLVNDHTVTLSNLSPNTLYHYRLKWTDVDGNVGLSSDYTFMTLGAPSAPTAVTATPTSGTTNSFGFSWTAPADEGVTVASYKYSVNSTPTANNTTTTTSRSVPAFAAATRQGLNTFYVVAVDDGGNVNYANYGSVDFTAYTTPPGAPKNITLTDSSDRDAKRYSLTLTWDAPDEAANDTIYYTIYRSTDGTAYGEIATLTSTGFLDTGLDSETTYYYKATARDKAEATSDPTKVVSDIPEGRFTQPPALTKNPTVAPDSYSATINWGTERIASSFVVYGTSQTALDGEQGTADLVIDHSIKVTGLKAQTVYYYKVKSIDVDENEAFSEVGTFTTLEAPKVSDVKISDIRLFDATISWTTNKEATTVINYGTTANYGLTYSEAGNSFSLTHTVKLEGLKDSQLYHLRLSGQDRSENPITSDDYTFTTQTFPKVENVTTKNKSQGQTEIFWKTNVPTTSQVEYYADNIAPKTQGNTAAVAEHSILLYGLEDATRYRFKVRGADSYGYEAVSAENEFTTLEDTTPPEVFGVKSESNTIGSGEASKVQIVVSWKTNEPTTSQVEFGVGLSGSDFTDSTDENAELVMDHLVVIGELSPAKTYHFRVVSRDKAGNQTKSGSYSVLTSRKRESFLQLIITNLEDTFSWLGNIGGTFN